MIEPCYLGCYEEGKGEGPGTRPRYTTMRWLFLILFVLANNATSAPLAVDESVVFYPTMGYRVAVGTNWELQIHGRVFEPKPRRISRAILRKAFELEHESMDRAAKAIFADRTRSFLEDNERGKRISIQLGETVHELNNSKPNGHFSGTVRLTDAELDRLRQGGAISNRMISFQAVTRSQHTNAFTGVVHLMDATGISVISDIDDTIKVSQVLDRKALVENTFIKPFQPVPGMAEVYQQWARQSSAQFHYVSASPWQLYLPLAEFIRGSGFPTGTFHLKVFRVKDRTFFSLFASPKAYKLAVIEPILKQFPERRFVLVGDSGEQDPETYGQLAREHPGQITRILIRDVTGTPAEASRYQKAFSGVSPSVWTIFHEPAEIKAALP